MKQLKWSGHFSGIGWTEERDGYEVLWFPGHALEALRVRCGQDKVIIRVSVDGVKESISEEMISKDTIASVSTILSVGTIVSAGTTGKKKALRYVKFQMASVDGADHIYYRVNLRHIGWTAFCRDGELCGTQSNQEDCFIEGIQLFWLHSWEEMRNALDHSERKLLNYIQIKDRLFINYPEKALAIQTCDFLDKNSAGVQEIKSGYVLPLRKTEVKTSNGTYLGGVVDQNGNFVAGLDRKRGLDVNYTCLGGYTFEEKGIDSLEETVIFGGVYISTFGHLFSECLSRLWWVVQHREVEYRIVVLSVPEQKSIKEDFFELLGIDKSRILYVNKITRISKIIVPDQTIRLHSDYKKEYNTIFDEIVRHVEAEKFSKIYLSRSSFSKGDGINEEFLEKFYEKRGFKVVAPEQYSVREQVAFMAGAEEVACTQGTLSHLGLFCRPGTKMTIFRRAENVLLPQFLVDQARHLETYYVDATFNFLPTRHTDSVFLYGPTAHFREYLDRYGFEYAPEEMEFRIEDYAYEYLLQWCRTYNHLKSFNQISGWDMFDVINNMNRVFGLPAISRKKYVTKVKEREEKLRQETEELRKKLLEYEGENGGNKT